MECSSEIVLLRLQKRQYEHDISAHSDILSLGIRDKLKHMALHFFKYAGKIQEAKEESNTSALRSVLLDSFIICMASANALNLSLGKDSGETVDGPSFDDLARSLSINVDIDDIFTFALRSHLTYGGQMAKILESSDHMESGDPRAQISCLLPKLTRANLIVLGRLGPNLEFMLEQRYAGIESKSIFHKI